MVTPLQPAIIDRAANDDPGAIAALLAHIRPPVLRYCRARLGPIGGTYTSADDVAQDVCLAILKALPNLREHPNRPLWAWIYTIASRAVTDAHRAAARAAGRVTDLDEEPADPTPGPEQQAEAADLADRLSTLLKQLTDTQREIVILRVAVGCTAEEVGETLGMTAASVRMAQSRALARLRTLAADMLKGATS